MTGYRLRDRETDADWGNPATTRGLTGGLCIGDPTFLDEPHPRQKRGGHCPACDRDYRASRREAARQSVVTPSQSRIAGKISTTIKDGPEAGALTPGDPQGLATRLSRSRNG